VLPDSARSEQTFLANAEDFSLDNSATRDVDAEETLRTQRRLLFGNVPFSPSTKRREAGSCSRRAALIRG
jgi:hypothetical protein